MEYKALTDEDVKKIKGSLVDPDFEVVRALEQEHAGLVHLPPSLSAAENQRRGARIKEIEDILDEYRPDDS